MLKDFLLDAFKGFLLVLLIGSGVCSASAKVAKLPPEMEIARLYQAPPAKSTRAVLEVKFANREPDEIVIPFRGLMRKALYNEIEKTEPVKRNCKVNGGAEDICVADFAEIRYQWKERDGSVALKGVFNASTENLHVHGKLSSSVIVPVDIPDKDGDYVLDLEFDNRSLYLPVSTSNYGPAFKYAFFRSVAVANVSFNRINDCKNENRSSE